MTLCDSFIFIEAQTNSFADFRQVRTIKKQSASYCWNTSNIILRPFLCQKAARYAHLFWMLAH
ncbi:hypothetical protein RC52_25970 [Herbaspirillum rubrisubalbicans]|nr:hypothetical protein [Herbaspirillum rubrisubalbicans]